MTLMTPQQRMALMAAAFCLAMALVPNGRSQGLARFTDGVVEVEVQKGADRSPENGTGFVVSVDGGTVTVLTARHLFYD